MANKIDVPKARDTLINVDMKGVLGVRNDRELRSLGLI
jgi:hypothetical protein